MSQQVLEFQGTAGPVEVSATNPLPTTATVSGGAITETNSAAILADTADMEASLAKLTSVSSVLTNIAAAIASTQLLAANANRVGCYIFNDSTATLYLAFAGAASTTSYTTQVPPATLYEMPPTPVWTGALFGIWSAANGNARITELS